MDHRRITTVLGATVGGLLAAAFLPMSVAAADSDDAAGGGLDDMLGGLLGGGGGDDLDSDDMFRNALNGFGDLLDDDDDAGGGGGGGGDDPLGGLLGGGGDDDGAGDEGGEGGEDAAGADEPGLGDIIMALIGKSDDPLLEAPFNYTGAAGDDADDDATPPNYTLEGHDGASITDSGFTGSQTLDVVQTNADAGDFTADDIADALNDYDDVDFADDDFGVYDPDLDDAADALASADGIDLSSDDIAGDDVEDALEDAGIAVDGDHDASDIAETLNGADLGDDGDISADDVSEALKDHGYDDAFTTADAQGPSIDGAAAALADSDDTNVLGDNVDDDDITDALHAAGIDIDSDSDIDAGDLADALNAADAEITAAEFDADVEQSQFLGFADQTHITVPDDVDFSDAGVNGHDGADAALPAGTEYDFTDFGAGFANVYTEIPAGDDGGGGIQDILVTPFGETDLSPIAEIIGLIDGSDAVGPEDVLNDIGSLIGF